jgi:multidrug efflux pump subunit AcrB
VNGLKNMWSHVDNNGGNIGLEFDWSQNMKVARTDVWEKIDRIRKDLPSDIGDITVSNNWDGRETETPIIEGRLSSKRNLSESYDLLERRIVKPLERIPGVAQVRLDGVNPREVRINLNVDKPRSARRRRARSNHVAAELQLRPLAGAHIGWRLALDVAHGGLVQER